MKRFASVFARVTVLAPACIGSSAIALATPLRRPPTLALERKDRAASVTTVPGVGHMGVLSAPAAQAALIRHALEPNPSQNPPIEEVRP